MLLKRVLKVWRNYFTSQFLVTIFIFLLTWLAGWLTGLRFAFPNGLAAGICEAIPNFGPIISGAISTALALIFGSSKLDLANWQFALIIAGICIVIQLLQSWLISPMLIGKTMFLNPVVVFIGMLVFSAMFGFWGMILAVPIMGTFKEVIKYSEEKKAQNSDKIEKVQEPDRIEKLQSPDSIEKSLDSNTTVKAQSYDRIEKVQSPDRLETP